jgi:Ca2+-binding EF-hand superfamily protein
MKRIRSEVSKQLRVKSTVLNEVFKSFDSSGDGQLTVTEMMDGFNAYGADLTLDEAQELFRCALM